MWFIGVGVEQETSTPPPNKILDPPLDVHVEYHVVIKYYSQTPGIGGGCQPL